jgi:hypothetical protein
MLTGHSLAGGIYNWTRVLRSGKPILAAGNVDVRFILAILGVSMSVLVTSLIILRIFLVRRKLMKMFGKAPDFTPYLGVISMLVESQVLYTAFGIVVLASLRTNRVVLNVFINSFSYV